MVTVGVPAPDHLRDLSPMIGPTRPPGMPYGTRYFARAETSTSANASIAHPRGRGALATPEGLPIVIDDAQVGSLLEYIQADILLHCLISMHGVGRKASAPPVFPDTALACGTDVFMKAQPVPQLHHVFPVCQPRSGYFCSPFGGCGIWFWSVCLEGVSY